MSNSSRVMNCLKNFNKDYFVLCGQDDKGFTLPHLYINVDDDEIMNVFTSCDGELNETEHFDNIKKAWIDHKNHILYDEHDNCCQAKIKLLNMMVVVDFEFYYGGNLLTAFAFIPATTMESIFTILLDDLKVIPFSDNGNDFRF